MPSRRRLAANRANAKLSTGPRTAEGKAGAGLNALKHGLAVPASAMPALAPDVARLARMIAGGDQAHPDVLAAATRVAEASIDLRRARLAKTQLLDRMVRDPEFLQSPPPEDPFPVRPKRLQVSVADYARAYRAGVGEQLWEAKEASLMHELIYDLEVDRTRSRRAEARQRAQQRQSQWEQLEKLDRYERRALSRRRAAIRAFDDARAVAKTLFSGEPDLDDSLPSEAQS